MQPHRTVVRKVGNEEIDLDRLRIYSTDTTRTGTLRGVSHYLDLATGEIIPAKELAIPTIDLKAKILARRKVLASLRPEVREFAHFVLRFANRRRGITPGIDVLCRWYAMLRNRQSSHVRRHIPMLYKAGVLAGDGLLAALFQKTGTTKDAHSGEDFRAWCIFQKLQRDRLMFAPTQQQQRGASPDLVADEVARLNAELETEKRTWEWRTYRGQRTWEPGRKPSDAPQHCQGDAASEVEYASG